MLRVEAITNEAELDRFAPEWQALWRRVGDATPFQSPDWLLPWWRSFGTQRPLVLTARAAGRLVGVLPLYRRDEAGCRKVLPIGISLSDYIDALVDRAIPAVADALLSAIAAQSGWDECHLPGLPPGAALLAAAAPPGLRDHRHQDETCLFVPLPPLLPRKKRQNLRRAWRATATAGAASVTLAAPEEVGTAMDALFRLHEKRWHRRGLPGVCAEEAVRRFHRGAADRLAASGLLRLYTLALDGAAVAVLYGFAAKRIAYAYLCGFDPECAKLGVGTQLLAYAIDEAARAGAREFHFLRGGETYKYSWGALPRPTFARTLRRT
ncbi:MAG TPA: GNAT family N-acetyltransferase [Stellaceae bacterium]|nr:GNAT family N-acetyltransferase [Stellaceae bacterium]